MSRGSNALMGSRRFVLAIVLAAAGCSSYEERPIDAARSEEALQARSLADPGLRAFVERTTRTRASDWPRKSWAVSDLLLAAVYFHPDVDVARARLRIAEGALVTAGGRPNPTLTVTPQYTYPSDLSGGSGPWTFGFSLDVPIETAGKRGDRIERAEHDIEAARLALAESIWRLRSRLRGALLDALLTGAEAESLGAEERLRADMQGLLEERLRAGEASAVEVHTARADLATARVAARNAEGRLAEARAAVAQAVGVPASALADTRIDWPGLDRPPTATALPLERVRRAGLLNRLDVRRGLAEYSAAEAALHLEVAKQYPDLHLGPGYQYDQGQNHYSLGIGVDLPILNQNQGPIAEARARREEAAALFLALQAEVLGDTERARRRYLGSLAELAEADRVLEEQVARGRSTEQSFAIGEADRVALDIARIEVATARRARVDALRRAQGALGSLEDAVEVPLVPAGQLPDAPLESPRAGERRGDEGP